MEMKDRTLRHALSRTYYMRGFVTGLFTCAAIYGYNHGNWMAVGGAGLAALFMIMAVFGETNGNRTKED